MGAPAVLGNLTGLQRAPEAEKTTIVMFPQISLQKNSDHGLRAGGPEPRVTPAIYHGDMASLLGAKWRITLAT